MKNNNKEVQIFGKEHLKVNATTQDAIIKEYNNMQEIEKIKKALNNIVALSFKDNSVNSAAIWTNAKIALELITN